MKKITLLLSFIVCVVFAQAQLLVNENFDYAAGSGLIGQGTWAIVGTSTTNPITVTAPGTPALTYTSYPSSGIGNELSITTTGQDVTHQFTAQTSGYVYFSVLVNVSAAQATGDYFIHLGEPASTSAYFSRVFGKLDGTGTKVVFGIQNGSGGTPTPTYTTAAYDYNTTNLLVVKVDVVSGASSLIVNPDMSAEPASANWISNSTGTTLPTSAGLGEINIRQGTATNAPTLKLDGIRVATSYTALFTTTGTSNPSANEFNAIVSGNNLLVKNVANGSTVEIYSAIGSKVQSSVLENGAVELNNLSKGMYIVRVGKLTQKIML